MKLEEFITTTLVAIAKGAANAKDECDKSVVEIPPGGDPAKAGLYQLVQFDVGLQETTEGGGGGGVNVNLGLVSVEGSGGGKRENASSTRVQFAIPIGFVWRAT